MIMMAAVWLLCAVTSWISASTLRPERRGCNASVRLLYKKKKKKKTNRKSRPIPEDIGLAAPKGGGQMSRGGEPHTLPELRHYYTPVYWHGRPHRLRAETESVEPSHPQSLHQHGHRPEAAAAW